MKNIIKEKSFVELTFRSVILAVLLTILLAVSNSYLALKLGILTSASIPAAIISMGILRLFKNSTILENNLVQTAASAGEAVAGGIVYTIPALIIIQYWQRFDYFTNFLIAACGGILGVLFSVPLRRLLVNDNTLKFPEGRAIAEVLKTSRAELGIKKIFMGGAIGSLFELLQTGFKVIASDWSTWFVIKRSLFGFGAGFSPAMIGAGYLVGYEMALSIFLGAVFSWLIALPIVSYFHPVFLQHYDIQKAGILLWNSEMRYLGIGAMLFAGTWTFLKLIKPLFKSIHLSFSWFSSSNHLEERLQRLDRDIPFPFIIIGVTFLAALLFFFLQDIFPLKNIGFSKLTQPAVVGVMVLYILIIGFLFSVITAYLSGMVGVTASPGSSVVIGGMLFAAWLLLWLIGHSQPLPLNEMQIKSAEAMTIIIGSIVTGIAAIANDNTQDLKVGQLVGATPWKQQVMLLVGVLISALIIPPIMQVLFDVYGIAGVLPHKGMDAHQSLPAPTAALMAAITEAVFRHMLPWNMMIVGASIILLLIVMIRLFKLNRFIRLSILGVAIGMYLPLASSIPLFFGGMIARFVSQRVENTPVGSEVKASRKQKGVLIACGLVAGAAIMDVLLAIPFSIFHNPDILKLTDVSWDKIALLLGVLSAFLLAWWIKYQVCDEKLD